jgi:hypothetical protein
MSIDSPPYSQSTPAPSYSAEPLENEERLEYTSRPRRHRLPTGKFTLSSGTITLVLNEQDSDASVPLYRQNGLVCGSVSIENCRNVASVSLKVCVYTYDLSIKTVIHSVRSSKAGYNGRLQKILQI